MKQLIAVMVLCASVTFAKADITITGTGKVKYTPDVAYVYLGVSSQAKDADESWRKNGEIVKKIFDKLRQMGIPEKDLQTSNLSIQPRYVHEKDKEPRFVGYEVTYDLTVTLRQLQQVGKVLDEAVKAGANRRVGIAFGCQDPEKLLEKARQAAVADARKRATLYAEGAGTMLGMVRTISEGGHHGWQRKTLQMPASGESGDSLPVVAGEQELQASVTVTWSLR